MGQSRPSDKRGTKRWVGTSLLECIAWSGFPTSQRIPQKSTSLNCEGINRVRRGRWGRGVEHVHPQWFPTKAVVGSLAATSWSRPSACCTSQAVCPGLVSVFVTCQHLWAATLWGHEGKAPDSASGWHFVTSWQAGITSAEFYLSVTKPGVKVRGHRPDSWWQGDKEF